MKRVASRLFVTRCRVSRCVSFSALVVTSIASSHAAFAQTLGSAAVDCVNGFFGGQVRCLDSEGAARLDSDLLKRRLAEVQASVGEPRLVFLRDTHRSLRRTVSGLFNCITREVVIEETFDSAFFEAATPVLIRGYPAPRRGGGEYSESDAQLYHALAESLQWFSSGLSKHDWDDPDVKLLVPPRIDFDELRGAEVDCRGRNGAWFDLNHPKQMTPAGAVLAEIPDDRETRSEVTLVSKVIAICEKGVVVFGLSSLDGKRFNSMAINVESGAGAISRARSLYQNIQRQADVRRAAISASQKFEKLTSRLTPIIIDDRMHYTATAAERLLSQTRTLVHSMLQKEKSSTGYSAAAEWVRGNLVLPSPGVAHRGNTLVAVQPKAAVDRVISAMRRFWSAFSGESDLSPDLAVWSTPTGAKFVMQVATSEPTRREAVTDNIIPNVWLGLYQATVTKQPGYQPVATVINLIDDPRTIIECVLVADGSREESACKQVSP
jgi:hypothetical protein